MKTNAIGTIAAAAAVAFAALFATSCDLINKMSETDIPLGDFRFEIDAVPTASATRADGHTQFAGSCTVLRYNLLANISGFDYAAIKGVSFDNAAITVPQDLGGARLETLRLVCEGVETVFEIKDVPLTGNVAYDQMDALETFLSAVITQAIETDSSNVSLVAEFDRVLAVETVRYMVSLTGIIVRVGLNL